MVTLDDHLLELVQKGLVERQDALDSAQEPKDLELRLGST
jgi:Tfp pilus assembly ATPase PilU